MRLRICSLIGVASVASSALCQPRSDGPSAEIMEQASRSVVQVLSRSCGREVNRTATGFVWRDRETVVTAYHAVAGCDQIALYIPGVGEISATVEHALTGADLALLRLRTASQILPLATATTAPIVNDTLQVIGFYYGVPTLGSVPVKMTLGSSILRDMLPDQLRTSLQSTPINLSTEILRINGSLVPGLSGAPIIDSVGAVAGIGSGGLENGAAGIGWAIRSRYLADLASAPPPSGQAYTNVRGQFSSSIEGENPQIISCGSYAFRRMKVRTLNELLSSADDAAGYYRLAAASGVTAAQLSAFTYAIYAEPTSGASIAVPANAVFRASNGECTASVGDGFTIRVSSSRVASPQDIQFASSAFEARFQQQGLSWVINPAFTYTAPLQRADGLVVNRKSLNGYLGGMPTGGSLETIMARGRVFIGIEVTETKIPAPYLYQCNMGSNRPECAQLLQDWQKWVAMSLGAHLSTFSPI